MAIMPLNRWRIAISEIAAVNVYKVKGQSTVYVTVYLKSGLEIKENAADIEEARKLVVAWGQANGIEGE